jgi:hypothetical protein
MGAVSFNFGKEVALSVEISVILFSIKTKPIKPEKELNFSGSFH